jgi:hypothetical protein
MNDLPEVLPLAEPTPAPRGRAAGARREVLEVVPLPEVPLTVQEVPPELPPAVRPYRGFFGWAAYCWSGLCSAVEWLFGAASLMVGLSVLAALPLLQFLSLGYLLEAGGRVARTRRLRDGFIGVRPAARVGGIFLGVGLTWLALGLVAAYAHAAELIAPGSPAARRWRAGLVALTVVLAVHVVAAVARGGKFRYFLWPLNAFWLARRLWRGGYYAEASNAVWTFCSELRLPYYFWLGVRGFAGGLLWLIVPVSLLAAGHRAPPLGFLGALLLGVVLLYLPFLQVRFAAENRFRVFFEVGAIRSAFRRAPWAFAFAFVVTLASALPLYLLKIEMVPREAPGHPSLLFIVVSLFFIAFIFPARLLTGWAYARALQRARPRHWVLRWLGWVWMPPAAAFYVLIIFFTQYTSWDGVLSLYEQHAFLLPVPFVGL